MQGAEAMETVQLPRLEPARVYQSPEADGHWIVEIPEHARQVQFNGPNALVMALRFAYEETGGARFFPF